MFDGFNFGDPAAWTKGHPFDVYKKMREQAPVRSLAKRAFLAFGSDPLRGHQTDGTGPQRFLVSAGQHQHGGAGPNAVEARVIPAALNLINMDEPLHHEMRMQQSDFFFPAYVATIRDRVATRIDGLLDEMERKGPVVDFAKMFSKNCRSLPCAKCLG